MSDQLSISAQVVALRDLGYSPEEIVKELHTRPSQKMVSLRRVQEILRPRRSRSEDSQRLLEIYEIVLEMLGIVRQLQSKYDSLKAPSRARRAEKEIRDRVNSRQPQSNPLSRW